ncbi:hypothetical protein KIPB_005478, partial [Kipferlia bialata]|eukprot:g5478.t1
MYTLYVYLTRSLLDALGDGHLSDTDTEGEPLVPVRPTGLRRHDTFLSQVLSRQRSVVTRDREREREAKSRGGSVSHNTSSLDLIPEFVTQPVHFSRRVSMNGGLWDMDQPPLGVVKDSPSQPYLEGLSFSASLPPQRERGRTERGHFETGRGFGMGTHTLMATQSTQDIMSHTHSHSRSGERERVHRDSAPIRPQLSTVPSGADRHSHKGITTETEREKERERVREYTGSPVVGTSAGSSSQLLPVPSPKYIRGSGALLGELKRRERDRDRDSHSGSGIKRRAAFSATVSKRRGTIGSHTDLKKLSYEGDMHELEEREGERETDMGMAPLSTVGGGADPLVQTPETDGSSDTEDLASLYVVEDSDLHTLQITGSEGDREGETHVNRSDWMQGSEATLMDKDGKSTSITAWNSFSIASSADTLTDHSPQSITSSTFGSCLDIRVKSGAPSLEWTKDRDQDTPPLTHRPGSGVRGCKACSDALSPLPEAVTLPDRSIEGDESDIEGDGEGEGERDTKKSVLSDSYSVSHTNDTHPSTHPLSTKDAVRLRERERERESVISVNGKGREGDSSMLSESVQSLRSSIHSNQSTVGSQGVRRHWSHVAPQMGGMSMGTMVEQVVDGQRQQASLGLSAPLSMAQPAVILDMVSVLRQRLHTDAMAAAKSNPSLSLSPSLSTSLDSEVELEGEGERESANTAEKQRERERVIEREYIKREVLTLDFDAHQWGRRYGDIALPYLAYLFHTLFCLEGVVSVRRYTAAVYMYSRMYRDSATSPYHNAVHAADTIC